MSYCTKCGTKLGEGEVTCRTCGHETENKNTLNKGTENREQENKDAQPTVDLSKSSSAPPNPAPTPPSQAHGLTPRQAGDGRPENTLSNGWKVFLTAVTLLVPFVGQVLGIIMSLIYLSSPHFDSKSYGKALLIMTVVYIGIGLVCCLGFMFLSMAGYMSDPGYFYDQFQVY